MDSPTVLINRSGFVFVQVDILLGVKVDEEFVIKREVNGFRRQEFDGIAPDFLISWSMQSGIDREIEVCALIGLKDKFLAKKANKS